MKQPLRILIAHNQYQQWGGEDSVVEAESSMLNKNGCVVETFLRHNDDLGDMPPLRAAINTYWSRKTQDDVAQVITRFRPDIIHVHNTFPLISPSIYWAASSSGIPVVQTLHNFRLMCPQAMLLRNGGICEDCLDRLPRRGILRKCYRGSLPQTAVLAGMLTLHRVLGTWQRKVTKYIALNEFCRSKFIQGGLPSERIAIKPNFVDVPRLTSTRREGGLFVGRLSPEKGIEVLLKALDRLEDADIEVVGAGPEQDRVNDHPRTRCLGALNQDDVMNEMRGAAYLVMPSICYENFPRTLVEAFACGLPVIASRLGAMADLVRDGETGLLFESGNADDLAKKIAWAEANSEEMREMGIRARQEYESKYTPEINYGQLMAIYADAIAAVKQEQRN